jgi:hypothetical protein
VSDVCQVPQKTGLKSPDGKQYEEPAGSYEIFTAVKPER